MTAPTMHDILHPSQAGQNSAFPNAPVGWTTAEAEQTASDMHLKMSEDHWELVKVLQGCYAEDQNPPIRRVCDALAAVFKPRGGRKYLHKLFPGGPVTQGCIIAGLEPPAGSSNQTTGVVQ